MTLIMPKLAQPAHYSCKVDASCDSLNALELRRSWLALLERVKLVEPLRVMPLWADHFLRTNNALRLIVVSDEEGNLAGVAPLHPWPFLFRFALKGKVLWEKSLRAEWLLGSVPALPEDAGAHDALFAAIHGSPGGADSLYLESVPTDSYLWRYLQHSKEIRKNWIMSLPTGRTRRYAIDLPDTFEGYLSQQLNKKMRHNLRREVKLLMGRSGEFIRIDKANQVDSFLTDAKEVVRLSWKKKLLSVDVNESERCAKVLYDLADQGLLRAYMVRCGGRPCAMGIGYQKDDVYHYYETAYNEEYAKLSPGKVLLFLMIEELINSRDRPARLSFGSGEMAYKDWFANSFQEDVAVLLLRKTVGNRLLSCAHAGVGAVGRWGRVVLERLKYGSPK